MKSYPPPTFAAYFFRHLTAFERDASKHCHNIRITIKLEARIIVMIAAVVVSLIFIVGLACGLTARVFRAPRERFTGPKATTFRKRAF
jgi:hypothetical protein